MYHVLFSCFFFLPWSYLLFLPTMTYALLLLFSLNSSFQFPFSGAADLSISTGSMHLLSKLAYHRLSLINSLFLKKRLLWYCLSFIIE
ncbi:hypothetical protein Y032_0006g2862 [Ancylostoma ceylanicum]|uniref:Uncharacterized protein n=1 Tax=Ancylostoma ceylanicum TaxID=53326 RepID=A0A016VP90_9BILA|nr:hypothetical protein Y032_0006g2862 [Ancylostoma ceylanicum]